MRAAIRLLTTLIIILVLISICFNSSALGLSIIIINETGIEIKIDLLQDSCGNELVKDKNPVILKNGHSIIFENVMPITHHYKICANGICVITTMGIVSHITEYILLAKLKGGCICVIEKPNIWPANSRCTQPLYSL